MATFFNRFAESISSTWRLLSDTTNYLSRAKMLEQYDAELRGWRERLSRSRNDPQVARAVREDIVALRKLLRFQGHDLRLGSKDVAIEGWRHDDAMAEGFRRIVLGCAEDDVYYVAGDANHIELAEMLESQCQSRRRCKPYSLHCLWYRWRSDLLVLSGAASETAEQFEEFRSWFETNKELLLRKLASL
ncbi:MAG: hypothetical protein ABSG17_01420 [Spirochaetia bacterium]|jgi:hypothetical protein